MDYSFAKTTNDNIVLLHNDVVLGKVENIPGFELIRIKIVDDAVDNISSHMAEEIIHAPGPVIHRERRRTNSYTTFADFITMFTFIFSWIAGIIIAAPGWDKVEAILPPYAWYLFIEQIMKYIGMIH